MYNIEDKSNRYQIIWDLGRRCSYACTYCPPHRNNKTSAFVNYETLCKSMDGVAEYALLYDSFRKKPAKKKLSFTGGEPTVHPDFFKFLKYVKSEYPDFSRGLTTNGWFNDRVTDKVISLTTGGTLSYHCESTKKQKEQVISNAIALKEKYKVNVMFHKDYFKECVDVCEKLEKNAVDFIIETCHQHQDKIFLCPTGPLTNIAQALKKDPSIKKKIKEIIFMGGAGMCLGNITPSAEFNIFVDPHAANIVLNSGIPLVMMGLDVTHKVNVDDKIINNILSNNNKCSKFFAELMDFYSKFHRKLYNSNSCPLHDPCVIAYLIDPTIFSGRFVNVIVEENSFLTRGKTVVDWFNTTEREKNCTVMVEADSEKFFALLKDRLLSLP